MTFPHDLLPLLAILTATVCALMGGLLFAFSNFVMRALLRQPPESGIRVMQAINSLILNPLFLSLFLGGALAAGVLAVAGMPGLSRLHGPLLTAGGILYLTGTFGVTVLVNVPLNRRLEAMDPASARAAAFWPDYVSRWVRWNHLRTASALGAAVLILLALRHNPAASM